MSKCLIPPSRWERLLDSLGRTYRRWPVDIETHEADGHVDHADADLDELYFDPDADRVGIRCGTRLVGVNHPTSVTLCDDEDDDRSLEVEGRNGTLRVRFHLLT